MATEAPEIFRTDPTLRRITFQHDPTIKPLAVDYPTGLEPIGDVPSGDLPGADVLVITYTTAEGQALADVLTPGHESEDWNPYTDDWSSYEPQLTGRSPAKWSKCLGKWAITKIGNNTAVLFKSDLHLSTDATSLPIEQLWQQLIAAVKPRLIITTGTAGGIGLDTVLGDVAVTNGAKFNCTKDFKDKPYAQQEFIGPSWEPGANMSVAYEKLMPINAVKLKPIATRDPTIWQALDVAGVETVDYFAFADATDSYHVVSNDPTAHNEEMDDAVLPLALTGMASKIPLIDGTAGTPWLSIRNASDPQVPHLSDLEAEKKWAEAIYVKYGYWTTLMSAYATWAAIADLAVA